MSQTNTIYDLTDIETSKERLVPPDPDYYWIGKPIETPILRIVVNGQPLFIKNLFSGLDRPITPDSLTEIKDFIKDSVPTIMTEFNGKTTIINMNHIDYATYEKILKFKAAHKSEPNTYITVYFRVSSEVNID